MFVVLGQYIPRKGKSLIVDNVWGPFDAFQDAFMAATKLERHYGDGYQTKVLTVVKPPVIILEG
jgi:hypothetical protein